MYSFPAPTIIINGKCSGTKLSKCIIAQFGTLAVQHGLTGHRIKPKAQEGTLGRAHFLAFPASRSHAFPGSWPCASWPALWTESFSHCQFSDAPFSASLFHLPNKVIKDNLPFKSQLISNHNAPLSKNLT